jgi:Ca2+-binding EF-hand superfamily protein
MEKVGKKGKKKHSGEKGGENQQLQLAFSIFDADGDGLISLSELENVLKAVGACAALNYARY